MGRIDDRKRRGGPGLDAAGAGASRPEGAGANGIPVGLHGLLKLAAADAAFGERLFAERDRLADGLGVPLTGSERRVLRGVPEGDLRRMVGALPAGGLERREFLRGTAAAAVMLLGGAAVAQVGGGCVWAGGARPDYPPDPADGYGPPAGSWEEMSGYLGRFHEFTTAAEAERLLGPPLAEVASPAAEGRVRIYYAVPGEPGQATWAEFAAGSGGFAGWLGSRLPASEVPAVP